MEYEVKISYSFSGIKKTNSFYKDVNTLDELKVAFLKRFGNIHDATNKALKEKSLVKKLTYSSKGLEEWVNSVNTHTRWELDIRQI